MQIKEVNTKSLENDFITVNVLMNKSNKAYIRPLDNDINDIFNPNKNKAYQNGNAKRWVLVDENGNLIGRIAAFISSKYI
ncbi:MAG TPA: hypothetical protein PLH33_02080, partial [Chitinophagaceae bacterium]|nr:hypothetical protein [Chitinophagaceae bacterium]